MIDTQYWCPRCKKGFDSEMEYYKHKRMHIDKDNGILTKEDKRILLQELYNNCRKYFHETKEGWYIYTWDLDLVIRQMNEGIIE